MPICSVFDLEIMYRLTFATSILVLILGCGGGANEPYVPDKDAPFDPLPVEAGDDAVGVEAPPPPPAPPAK